MRKEIPAPTSDGKTLTKVKQTFRELPGRTVIGHKSVLDKIVIKNDVKVPEDALDLFEDQPVKHSLKKKVVVLIVEGVVGGILTTLGVINAGSYYTLASRFGGRLADIFYTYQVGTIMIVIGILLAYDAIKRVRT